MQKAVKNFLNLTLVECNCPLCQQWQGRVYIDDVYSGGVSDGKYPLLSTAIAGGMFHPNCQNGLSTFIEGINSIPSPPTKSEKQEQIKNYDLQQQQRYNERQIRRYKRLSEYSLDDENRQKYSARLKEWQARQRKLISDNPDILRRQYDREKIYDGIVLNVSTDKLQYYKNATLDSNNARDDIRGMITIHSKKANYADGSLKYSIYISDNVKFKNKLLHDVDSAITKSLKLLNLSDSNNIPVILVMSNAEIQKSMLASYFAPKNILILDEHFIGKNSELTKDFACPNKIISTVLHEMIHWKDAEDYRRMFGEIKDYGKYVDYLNEKCKKELDKLFPESYNYYNISQYAGDSYKDLKYFETYTEYRVNKLLKG